MFYYRTQVYTFVFSYSADLFFCRKNKVFIIIIIIIIIINIIIINPEHSNQISNVKVLLYFVS